MSTEGSRVAEKIQACVNCATEVESSSAAAVTEAEAMLGAAHDLGVAKAISDVAIVVQRLVRVAERLQKIPPELIRLLTVVQGFDESPNSLPRAASTDRAVSTRPTSPLTMIDVPGVGRMPAGQRLGVIPSGEFEEGIHEYGKNACFSEDERRTAEFLYSRHPGEAFHAWADDYGRSTLKNPDCIRRPDADSPGIPVEFKTLDAATGNAVHQRIRSAAQQVQNQGGGEVVIDGRNVGLSRSVAEAGCARFLRNAQHHNSYIPTKITIILPDDDHYEPRMS